MLVSATEMRQACYVIFGISADCSKLERYVEEKKGETTLNRMREDHFSFGCSFRLFFILSEPVVPPLITTVLRHSWVWSLEILQWAKIFSYVIYLRCVSADHFKWSSVVLTASSPASDPMFVVALAQKRSRHSFLLNLSLSQHHRAPCSPSHSSDAQIKLSGSSAVLQKGQRDNSNSHCIFIESLQCLGFFRFIQITLLAFFSIFFSVCGFFSSQVKFSVHRTDGAERHLALTHQWLLSCFLGSVVNHSACETAIVVQLCTKPTLDNVIAC